MLAIYGYSRERKALLGPWRAFGGEWAPVTAPKAATGYSPAGGEISSPVSPTAYRIDDHALVMLQDGKWRAAGWAYSAVGDYVKGLWEQDLRAPGSYLVLIPPYREAIKAAPFLPKGSEAVVDLTSCERRADVLEAVELTGGRIEQDPESGKEQVRLPWSIETGHKLAYLPHAATTWHVPEMPAADVARLCA